MKTVISWFVSLRCSRCQTYMFSLSWTDGKLICGLGLSSIWRYRNCWDIWLQFESTKMFISQSVILRPLEWRTSSIQMAWFFMSAKHLITNRNMLKCLKDAECRKQWPVTPSATQFAGQEIWQLVVAVIYTWKHNSNENEMCLFSTPMKLWTAYILVPIWHKICAYIPLLQWLNYHESKPATYYISIIRNHALMMVISFQKPD